MVPHNEVGALQVATHAPAVQRWPLPHALAHAPQLSESFLVSMHAPPQTCWPALQVATHAPAVQRRPAAQALAQAPQLLESVSSETHAMSH